MSLYECFYSFDVGRVAKGKPRKPAENRRGAYGGVMIAG